MTDHSNLLAAIDSGDRTALYLIADWYEERGDDLGAGLRWILREEKIPGRPWKFDLSGYITGLDTWFRGNGPVADRESLPDSVYRELAGDSVYQYLSEYPTPSAAYLDAAAAACKALRSCCGQLWGEGEACGECGSKYRVADFYEPAAIEIDHDVRDSIRDWAND